MLVYLKGLPMTTATATADVVLVDADTFADSIRKCSARRAFLTVYTADEYRAMRCYLTPDLCAGFAVTRTGEIVSLHNAGKQRGLGDALVDAAIRAGGWRLDCFDGYLSALYARHGFVVIERMTWDDTYAPEGWDYATYGRPDVVVMALPREARRPDWRHALD